MNTDSKSLAVSAALRAALGYYRLVAEIGRGGMASVLLALFPNGDGTSRRAVLKQLHPELAMDSDFRAMFEEEAQLATRLHHENVVETFDHYCEGDLCVLVMEFLDGQTLARVRQRARKVNRVPLSIHLRILADVLCGLHYLHELDDEDGRPLGMVHRDVTPSNVFITYDGRVKIVDFGIAKATARVAETRLGVLKGKLTYMSPEAVRGEPVDRRSDIFSVGVMLWEAVTGLGLWQDCDEVAVYRRLAAGDLPLQPSGVEIANPDLFRVAARALSVDPSQRYDSAEEMRREVERFLAQLGKTVRAPAISAYMESFFSVEREKLQQIIDEARARFPTKPVSQRRLLSNEVSKSYPALDPSEPPTTVSMPSTVSSPSTVLSSSGSTIRTTSFDVPLGVDEVPAFRPRRLPFLLTSGAALLAVGVAIVAHAPSGLRDFSFSRPQHGLVKAHSAREPAVLSAPVVEPAPASPKPIVTVALSARPIEAHFYVDDEPVEGNPVTLQRLMDARQHRIRVEAVGYVSVSRSLDFAHDLVGDFELAPQPPSPAATAHVLRAVDLPFDVPKAQARRGRRGLDREDPWGI
jgi:serine/threonine-protein kinase